MNKMDIEDKASDLNTTFDGASSHGDEDSDSDTQQVSSKDYDSTPDRRDMRRLGKRQELKVTKSVADCLTVVLNFSSAGSDSSPLLDMSLSSV